MPKSKNQKTKKNDSPRGRRFTDEQKADALRLCATDLTHQKVADIVGCSPESLRLWHQAAKKSGLFLQPKTEMPTPTQDAPSKTAPPVHRDGGLAPVEVEAILELKQKHPSMGPAQIRAQLKRFRGWRLSVKAIARVLRHHGYRLVHIGSRPEGDEHPTRFEAPHRNALWQLDFAEVRIGPERRYVLFILDDYSRFLVDGCLCETPSSEVAVQALERAIARHGKPEAVYTDRGGAFLAWRDPSDFQRFLERHLIEHHVSRPYHPQGRGKVEAIIGTLRRELWEVRHFDSVADAEGALADWVDHYNHRRAHLALDGLTPADRFYGRAERVRAALAARIRDRCLTAAAAAPAGAPIEEEASAASVEILRLVLVNHRAELRLCGARVDLGPVQ